MTATEMVLAGLLALALLVCYRALGVVNKQRIRLSNMERALARAEAAPEPFIPPARTHVIPPSLQHVPAPKPPPPAMPDETAVLPDFMPGRTQVRSHRRGSPDQTQPTPDIGSVP